MSEQEPRPILVAESSRGHIVLVELIARAVSNGAFRENHDEAGDDQYFVQFPNHEPRWYDGDELTGAVREFNKPWAVSSV